MKNLWICSLARLPPPLETAYRLNESRRDLVFRCSPDRCLEVVFRFRVVELDRPQSSGVKQPPDRLSLVDLSLEVRLCDQSVRLVVLVVGEVRAQEKVDHGHFGRFVLAQRGGLSSSEKQTEISAASAGSPTGRCVCTHD